MKEMLYEVRCLKSNEDMILALAGQFKQLSHEPEKFRRLNGIRTHNLCDAGAVIKPLAIYPPYTLTLDNWKNKPDHGGH